MAEVEDALDLVKNDSLPSRQAEIEALVKAVRPSKKSAANSIVDLVIKDYLADSR
jgi:hypothetical protein